MPRDCCAIRRSRRRACVRCSRCTARLMATPDPGAALDQHRDAPRAVDVAADHRRLRASRHPRHLAVARPGRAGRASTNRRAHSRRRPALSAATAAAACSPRRMPRGRRAAIDDNRRAVDEALALGARCLVLVVGGLPKDCERPSGVEGPDRRARDGARRDRCAARVRAPGGHAARDRAAASDVRSRPRLRQHAGAGARSVRSVAPE